MALPITAVDTRNRHPRREADANQRLHQMVLADDLILAGKAVNKPNRLIEACELRSVHGSSALRGRGWPLGATKVALL